MSSSSPLEIERRENGVVARFVEAEKSRRTVTCDGIADLQHARSRSLGRPDFHEHDFVDVGVLVLSGNKPTQAFVADCRTAVVPHVAEHHASEERLAVGHDVENKKLNLTGLRVQPTGDLHGRVL